MKLDLTDYKLSYGKVYLLTIYNMYSKTILSRRVSNTIDNYFTYRCLKKLLHSVGYQALSVPIKEVSSDLDNSCFEIIIT